MITQKMLTRYIASLTVMAILGLLICLYDAVNILFVIAFLVSIAAVVANAIELIRAFKTAYDTVLHEKIEQLSTIERLRTRLQELSANHESLKMDHFINIHSQ